MAVSQLPQAPFRQDRKIFPTPIIGDVLFSEVRDCNRGKDPFPEYGTPHPNPDRWPNHKLVFIKPVDIERNEIFEFFYAADRENQDLYNFAFGLQSVGTNRQFRAVQRTYITPRADFKPLDIEFATPMADVPAGKFDGVEYVFFTRQQQPIQEQELNSLYVAEVHTYIEKAFLDDKLSYAAQRNDPTPEKFQILTPQQSTEEIVEGEAAMPTLTGSQLSVAEDQINPDIKLVRTTSRDRTSLPVSLQQKSTTNTKQVATITETLQVGDSIESPSALVDIDTEALGDGTYVVRKTQIPKVFSERTESIEKFDNIPEKFRAEIPTVTRASVKIGEVSTPALTAGELSRTEQQVNEFVYREQIVSRTPLLNAALPQVKRAYVEGAVADVDEKLSTDSTIETGLSVSESTATPIGDGKFIVQTVKVDDWPELTSSEWDPTIDAAVVRTEQMVSPPSSFDEPNVSYRSVNKDRSLKITEQEPAAALESYMLTFPVQVDLRLPDVLKNISVVYSEDLGEGQYDSNWSGFSTGTSYSLTGSESASSESSASIRPELIIDIERPWGADISATAHYFFLKSSGGGISEGQILSKLNAKRWPTFKPVSHTIVLTGGSANVQAKVNWNASSSKSPSNTTQDQLAGQGTSYSVGSSVNAVNIPPTIHGNVNIGGSVTKTKTVTATATSSTGATVNFPNISVTDTATHTLKAGVSPTSLGATSPPSIPSSGKYVVKSEVSPYKWGWFRCSAVVVDASNLQ